MEIIERGEIQIRKDVPELGVRHGGETEYWKMPGGIPCPKWGRWKDSTYYTIMRFVTMEHCKWCPFHRGYKSYSPVQGDAVESIICSHADHVRETSRQLRKSVFQASPIQIINIESEGQYAGI